MLLLGYLKLKTHDRIFKDFIRGRKILSIEIVSAIRPNDEISIYLYLAISENIDGFRDIGNKKYFSQNSMSINFPVPPKKKLLYNFLKNSTLSIDT